MVPKAGTTPAASNPKGWCNSCPGKPYPEGGMMHLHIAFGFVLTNTADSGCWQYVQLLHFMKFCCNASFHLWLQQKYEKLLLTPNTSNGHFHCSEKASEQASPLLCEYLFGALLAPKHMTRRKDLHQMPLLACYLQSWQLAVGSKCHSAELHGLTSVGLKLLDVWSLTACKISSKNDDHLSPKTIPWWLACTTTSKYSPYLHNCFGKVLWSVAFLQKNPKKQKTNSYQTTPWNKCVRWDQTFHPNNYFFDTHYTTVRNRIFQFIHQYAGERGYSIYRLNQNLLWDYTFLQP